MSRPAVLASEGDLVGFALAAHHLPLARIDPVALVSRAQHQHRAGPNRDDGAGHGCRRTLSIKRRVKSEIRAFFHPLHGGSDAYNGKKHDFMLSDLETALKGIPGVASVALLELQADAARLTTDLTQDGQIVGLRFDPSLDVTLEPRVLFDWWHVEVSVQGI